MLHRTQSKIIFIMAMIALMMMSGLNLLKKSDQKKVALLLSNQRREKETLLSKIIELKSKSVGNFAYDYTYWDQMVDFVKSGNKAWAEENIDISMPTYGVDIACVYRTDLSVMYSKNRTGADHLNPLPLSKEILGKIVSKGPLSHFFLLTDSVVLEMFSASIHPTNDPERKTPPQGYFFVGCLWTETYLKEISNLSETDISLAPLGQEQTDSYKEDFTITNIKALSGWDGTPIVNVRFTSKAVIAKELDTQSHVQYLISIAYSIILLMFLSFILYWLINRPLNQLSKSLTEGNTVLIKELASQKNEFGNLAVIINEFFNQKNRLVKEIAERKQAEETILKERTLLRTLIDHLPVGIFVKDMKYRKIIANPIHLNEVNGHIKHLGMNSEIDILCKTDFEVFPEKLAHNFFIEDQKVIQDGSLILNSEGLGYSEKGDPLWLLTSKIPFRDNNGKIVGMVGVTTDITERKQAEEKLRENEERMRDIIFSVGEWVWEVDENGRYTYSSKKGQDFLGYALEDIIGKTPFDFMPLEEAERVKSIFSEIVSNKAPIQDLENWNLRKDGEKICLLTNGVPILDENGNLKGYRGVDKNITERKRVEDKIRNDLEEKRLLLKEIHHRVKNNLQIIISLIRIQARSVEDVTALNAFKASINRIHSMSLVHEQLYATDNFKDIPFKRYIENISTNLLKSSNLSSRISLDLDIQNIELGIDLAIPCGLIVNELLTNSIKYAFPNQRECKIRISMRLSKDNHYEFIYQDNGIGMRVPIDQSETGSFGIKLINLLTEQINGKMILRGDKGTCYKITFPKDQK